MNDHDPPQESENPLTPLVGAIISDFSQRHDLAEVVALHARLAEVCGDDTLLNIVCDQTGCHLHVTTFGVCCQPN
ncbi:hypothetical protein [Brevundimonas sp. PAMC22021]|uniref:hypothetical protein n=1 Tax=Brevundimonas sp. PAMC22021 TaxID=2861285 RepID=UPI001C632F03|nr:hypothetical protein [Brevundimonas sp. PAMC22021]QYF87372.1 hypothetical protein KY493_02380 [Brevundimonas sp. PAMC22021]